MQVQLFLCSMQFNTILRIDSLDLSLFIYDDEKYKEFFLLGNYSLHITCNFKHVTPISSWRN